MAIEEEHLRASILDRLVQEGNQNRFAGLQNLDQLVASVHGNLEKLLNTRWRISSWPPKLDELEDSLVNYGIPDFAGINMSSPTARIEFRELVEASIRRNEPRFIRVHVELQENTDEADRTLRFTIHALLRADPEPEEVHFDSQVEPTSYRISVNESAR